MDARTHGTAQTLVDFYAGFASSDQDSTQRKAFETTMNQLNEVEAVIATQDDEGALSLNFTALLTASGVTYQWMFEQLSTATGRSEEELVFELRSFLDGLRQASGT